MTTLAQQLACAIACTTAGLNTKLMLRGENFNLQGLPELCLATADALVTDSPAMTDLCEHTASTIEIMIGSWLGAGYEEEDLIFLGALQHGADSCRGMAEQLRAEEAKDQAEITARRAMRERGDVH